VGKHLIPIDFARAVLLCMAAALVLAAPLGAQAREGVGSDPIRPGDVVRLTVLSDAGLSGDYPVNQFGTVVLPVVGEYEVATETQRSLRDKVIQDLREVRNAPDIELIVLRRVRVVGEVNQPGVYPLDPTMTIADAVAMARGRTELATEGKVLLRRGAQVIDADLRLDLPLSESPVQSGDEIFIPRRGWFDRNLGIVVAAASTAVTVVLTLLLSNNQ